MGDRPRLEVVAEQSDRALRTSRAAEQVRGRLIELAANVLRVSRGAGRPYSVGNECLAVVQAIQAYREAAGQWPPSELIASALDFTGPSRDGKMSDEARAAEYARERIIRGAMQFAASSLLGQRTQISAGESEMRAGIQALDRAEREMWGEPVKRRARAAAPKRKPGGKISL